MAYIKKGNSKAGRPKIKIDKKQFENLCGLHCTQEEIAAFFECDPDTIQNWCKEEYKQNFSEVFREKRDRGKISLRRSQWKLAETNPTLSIWLGKQYLGQKDEKSFEVTQVPVIIDDIPEEIEEIEEGE